MRAFLTENILDFINFIPYCSNLVIDSLTLRLAVDLHHDAVEGKALVARLLPSHRGGQEEVAALRPLPAQGHPGT